MLRWCYARCSFWPARWAQRDWSPAITHRRMCTQTVEGVPGHVGRWPLGQCIEQRPAAVPVVEHREHAGERRDISAG